MGHWDRFKFTMQNLGLSEYHLWKYKRFVRYLTLCFIISKFLEYYNFMVCLVAILEDELICPRKENRFEPIGIWCLSVFLFVLTSNFHHEGYFQASFVFSWRWGELFPWFSILLPKYSFIVKIWSVLMLILFIYRWDYDI